MPANMQVVGIVIGVVGLIIGYLQVHYAREQLKAAEASQKQAEDLVRQALSIVAEARQGARDKDNRIVEPTSDEIRTILGHLNYCLHPDDVHIEIRRRSFHIAGNSVDWTLTFKVWGIVYGVQIAIAYYHVIFKWLRQWFG